MNKKFVKEVTESLKEAYLYVNHSVCVCHDHEDGQQYLPELREILSKLYKLEMKIKGEKNGE